MDGNIPNGNVPSAIAAFIALIALLIWHARKSKNERRKGMKKG